MAMALTAFCGGFLSLVHRFSAAQLTPLMCACNFLSYLLQPLQLPSL